MSEYINPGRLRRSGWVGVCPELLICWFDPRRSWRLRPHARPWTFLQGQRGQEFLHLLVCNGLEVLSNFKHLNWLKIAILHIYNKVDTGIFSRSSKKNKQFNVLAILHLTLVSNNLYSLTVEIYFFLPVLKSLFIIPKLSTTISYGFTRIWSIICLESVQSSKHLKFIKKAKQLILPIELVFQ